jgi:hypothetical protein
MRYFPFGTATSKIIPYPGGSAFQAGSVPLPPSLLDRALSAFLKKARGEMSFAEFERKTGVPSSTLHRVEMGEQSMTMGKLTTMLKRLNLSLEDVFGATTKKKFTRRD